ncbi:hypothetical protein PHLCEN_2v11968 [Hermanssonia centrifuga]|uniref:Conidiation-specific protein 6 n=1 Tax=Hermanssonia centrifuga TaxID=98765 RepID=A0A2R6NIG8_9APHY|nr:hypothetical protein PHLCEN_2v11968 [Hermanssonia centrifuga]
MGGALTENKNPERVAAGLKAAIHNPNVSEEAKERAEDRLEQMGAGTGRSRSGSTEQETNRQLGGYKATLANEQTSPEAKAHAREILEAHGYTIERPDDISENEHDTRVLAGYKAALSMQRTGGYVSNTDRFPSCDKQLLAGFRPYLRIAKNPASHRSQRRGALSIDHGAPGLEASHGSEPSWQLLIALDF